MEERLQRVNEKNDEVKEIDKYVRKTSITPDQINGYLEQQGSKALSQQVKLHSVLMRPNISLAEMRNVLPELDKALTKYTPEVVNLAEVGLKYEGYIRKEQEMVDKFLKEYASLEHISHPLTFLHDASPYGNGYIEGPLCPTYDENVYIGMMEYRMREGN